MVCIWLSYSCFALLSTHRPGCPRTMVPICNRSLWHRWRRQFLVKLVIISELRLFGTIDDHYSCATRRQVGTVLGVATFRLAFRRSSTEAYQSADSSGQNQEPSYSQPCDHRRGHRSIRVLLAGSGWLP